MDSEREEELIVQFNDAFNKTEYNEVPLTRRSAPFRDSIVISAGVNPSEALRPDELHPRVLKEQANEPCPVFTNLFQQSLDTGEIPKEWLLANFCLLFKKGDRALACNYRPCPLHVCHVSCLNI